MNETPIGTGFAKLREKDRKSLEVKFIAAYYLAKKERSFSDYQELLDLQEKNGVNNIGKSYRTDRPAAVFTDYIGEVTKKSLQSDISKARYYSLLSDGSSDSANIEQECVYLLYLSEGTPTVKFLSIESVQDADDEGIHNALKEAFQRFGITNFSDHLVGLNVELSPWMLLMFQS